MTKNWSYQKFQKINKMLKKKPVKFYAKKLFRVNTVTILKVVLMS